MLLIVFCLLTYCSKAQDLDKISASNDNTPSTPQTSKPKKLSNIVKRSVSKLELLKLKPKALSPAIKMKKATSLNSINSFGSTSDLKESGLQTPIEKKGGFFKKPKKYPSFIGSMDKLGLEDDKPTTINSACSTADLSIVGLNSKDKDDLSEISSEKEGNINKDKLPVNGVNNKPKIVATHEKGSSSNNTPTTPLSLSLHSSEENVLFDGKKPKLYSKLPKKRLRNKSTTSEDDYDNVKPESEDISENEPEKMENSSEGQPVEEDMNGNEDNTEESTSRSFIKSLRSDKPIPSPRVSGIPKVVRRKEKSNELMKRVTSESDIRRSLVDESTNSSNNDEMVFQYIPRLVTIALKDNEKDKYKTKFFEAVNLFNTKPEMINSFKLLVYAYQNYCKENLEQDQKVVKPKVGFNTLFLSRKNKITFTLMKLSECEDLEAVYDLVHSGDKKMHFNDKIIKYLKECSGGNDSEEIAFTINLKTTTHEISLLELALYFLAKHCYENL